MWILVLAEDTAGYLKDDVIKTHIAPKNGKFYFLKVVDNKDKVITIPINNHFLLEID